MVEIKKPFCWKRFCGKSFLVLLEFFALIAIFVGAVAAVFLWRVSQSPVDLEFARPKVQQALNERINGQRFTVEKLVLYWPDMKGPILFGLRNGQLNAADGAEILRVEEVGMGLSLPHLLIGRVVPTALIVQAPHISVVVEEDGGLDIGFGANRIEAAASDEAQQSLLERIVGYVGSPYHDSDESPLAALERFEVKGAVVRVEDRAAGMVLDIPRFDMRLQTQDGGLGGRLAAYLDADVQEPHVEAKMTLPWQAQQAEAVILLRDFPFSYVDERVDGFSFEAEQKVALSGELKGLFDQGLNPLAVHLDLATAGGQTVIHGYRAEAVSVSDVRLAGMYDARGEAEILTLEDLSLRLADVPFRFDGQVHSAEGGYDARVAVRSEGLMASQMVDILPDSLQEEGVYEWLTEKLSGGRYSALGADADLALRYGDGAWGAQVNALKAQFDYSDMEITYKLGMMPITEAQGSGRFDYVSELLQVELESGKVGGLEARDGQVELAHIIEGGRGKVDVNVTLDGPLRDMFVYLEREPIALQHGYDLARVEGVASVNVNLGLPTYGDVQFEDVALQVRGDVSGAKLPNILVNTDLTGASAQLVVDDNDLSIRGNGRFLGEAVRFDYAGYLSSDGAPFKERITVSGRATEAVRQRFDLDLSAFMSGPAGVDVVYTKFDDVRQTVDVKADLKNSLLFVEPVQYVKAAGAAGRAALKLDMRNGFVRSVSGLSAQAEGFALKGGKLGFAQRSGQTILVDGAASDFKIGVTEGALTFEVSAAEQYQIDLDLDVLDLRPVLSREDQGEDGEEGLALVMAIEAEHVLTEGDGFVRQAKIYLDMDPQGSFNQLELDALTESGSDIYLRYKPDGAGSRVFRFEADDAGETLAAFGLYDQIRGGQILIHGDPVGDEDDRNLVGVAEITNFEVVNAPTLARLLSLMSLDGLASGMSGGSGLQFSRLESKFDWVYRPRGSLLVLQEGRTSGNAVGLTFDGVIDQGAGTIDVTGTVIPVSEVNKVIKSIPLLGEILTGGSGVFAATYAVKGEAKNPKVSINPLSVLTPGIIRRILFE